MLPLDCRCPAVDSTLKSSYNPGWKGAKGFAPFVSSRWGSGGRRFKSAFLTSAGQAPGQAGGAGAPGGSVSERGSMNWVRCVSCSASCILNGLAEWQRMEVSQLARLVHFGRGQVIWQEGLFRDGCYILCEGTALLSVSAVFGKRRVVKLLQPGDVLSTFCASERREFSAEILSTEAVLVIFIPEKQFGALTTEYPSVAMKLTEKLSAEVLDLCRELAACSYLRTRAKVQRLLAELQRLGQLESRTYSQQVLAEMVGASREGVNKAIRGMARLGLLSCQDGHIQILDGRQPL